VLSSQELATAFALPASVYVVKPTVTEHYSLGCINHNEGANDGTAAVHEDVWIDKLGFKREADKGHFGEHLSLAFDDAATAIRIRNVKSQNAESERAFERRDWLLSSSSLFHTAMNLCYTVHRLFWNESS